MICCCIPTLTTDSNIGMGMIQVTLNMPSAANCQGIVREFHVVWRVLTVSVYYSFGHYHFCCHHSRAILILFLYCNCCMLQWNRLKQCYRLKMTSSDLDPVFVKALKLLQSRSKDSYFQLKQMYDEVVAQRRDEVAVKRVIITTIRFDRWFCSVCVFWCKFVSMPFYTRFV